MANNNLGRFVIEWADEYNSATAYVILKAVSLNGSSYLCIAPCTNKNPETETGYWAKIASVGDSAYQHAVDGGYAGTLNDFETAMASIETKMDLVDATALKADAMASGSPKGRYSTLAALEAALPAGDTGAYLVEADSHLYFWDTVTSAWVDGGEYNVAHANKVTLTDSGSYFPTKNVEAALQTVGENIEAIDPTVLDLTTFTGTLILGGGGTSISRTGTNPVDPLTWESDGSYNGLKNTFLGVDAGTHTTTGNTNTFVGFEAGHRNINGDQNTFIGWVAGEKNVSGYHNTYLGVGAAQDNTDGWFNVYIGCDCGIYSDHGHGVVAVGTSCASLNQGDNNTVVGCNAFIKNVTGGENVAVGTFALAENLAGKNTAIGYIAGNKNTTGYNNSFLGWGAGYKNVDGYQNAFFGYGAGYENVGGYRNTFLGTGAGQDNTDGYLNVFIGYSCGLYGDHAHGVVAIGTSCASLNEGSNNTVVGADAFVNNVTGAENVVIGTFAMANNLAGRSVAVGYHALGDLVSAINGTSAGNTALGYLAGAIPVTHEQNTFLGYMAGGVAEQGDNLYNSTAIGAGSYFTANNVIQLGNAAIDKVYTHGDFEAQDIGDGFICKSPDGTRYRITVANGGTVAVAAA